MADHVSGSRFPAGAAHTCISGSARGQPGPMRIHGGTMARIIGGIASSHSPTIGFAHDRHNEDDPVWGPIFQAYKPVRQWLAEKKPDVLFIIYNDHVTSFFFDHYSHFALGIGESYDPADEGGGPRALPPIKGHTGL